MGKLPEKPELPHLTPQHCLSMARTCAAYNLRRVTRLVTQRFDEVLAPSGLRVTQFSLLVAAYLNEKVVLNKLAHAMGMDRTSLSRSLKLLEKRGLVQMEPGEDRREVIVRLTPEGRDRLDLACPLWQKAQEQILSGLHPGQWELMISDLKDLAAGLK